jgi:hypothetical protein
MLELKDIESNARMSEISRRWKELDADEKQSYTIRVKESMQKYASDFADYVASLPAEEQEKAREGEANRTKPTNAKVCTSTQIDL